MKTFGSPLPYAVLAQSGLLSEPQQYKYAVRRLVTTLGRTRFCSYCVGFKAWGLSGQRVRLSISRRGFDSWFRCIFLSFFLRGVFTKVRLRTPLTNVFSVAEWLALLRCQ